MIQCNICNDKSRRKSDALEHYERFHKPPTMNNDGTIQINAIHYICMILKGDDTWEQQLKKEIKRKDESAITGIKQIQAFEHNHNVELDYCKENKVSYSNLDVSLSDRIRSFFRMNTTDETIGNAQ